MFNVTVVHKIERSFKKNGSIHIHDFLNFESTAVTN